MVEEGEGAGGVCRPSLSLGLLGGYTSNFYPACSSSDGSGTGRSLSALCVSLGWALRGHDR